MRILSPENAATRDRPEMRNEIRNITGNALIAIITPIMLRLTLFFSSSKHRTSALIIFVPTYQYNTISGMKTVNVVDIIHGMLFLCPQFLLYKYAHSSFLLCGSPVLTVYWAPLQIAADP